jgi:hypothetical protein
MAGYCLGITKIHESSLILSGRNCRSLRSKKDGPALDCSNFKSRGVGPSTSSRDLTIARLIYRLLRALISYSSGQPRLLGQISFNLRYVVHSA